ncbi:MAG: hypothetical protein JKY80_01435 [Mariprofundaceae bacterium]|nr:hypothetical protein [Mariprofundaceae bacterium]
MLDQTLKATLAAKTLTVGSWLSLSDLDVCEMMAKSDFDWLVVDMEHSSIGLKEMSRMVQVIDLAGCCPLVRVGANDPLLIKQALEAGAEGIIVPMVNNVAEAKAAVSAAHYPPKGVRGVGLYRAQDYGAGFEAYQKKAATNTVVIVQIEHRDAVNNLAAIMDVDGVDAFMVGPYDLSGSFGKPGDFDAPETVEALAKVRDYCVSGAKAGGIHAVLNAGDDLSKRIDEGYRFIAYGSDMIFLSEKIQAEKRLISDVLG